MNDEQISGKKASMKSWMSKEQIGLLVFLLIGLGITGFSLLPNRMEAGMVAPSVGPFSIEQEGGYFEEPLAVNIIIPAGKQVYYTLDGSRPRLNSTIYSAALWLSESLCKRELMQQSGSSRWKNPSWPLPKGITLRAAVIDEWGTIEQELVRTFIFAPAASLPTVMIVCDPDSFSGFVSGIYTPGISALTKGAEFGTKWWDVAGNYSQRGAKSDRQAFVEYHSQDDLWASEIKLRIHGNATRAFPQKSFRISVADKKDDASFPPVTLNTEGQGFQTLILRNGGNDSYKTHFRDALAHRLAARMDLDVQASQAAIVYVNGEYWGLYNIRERQDREYLERRYAVSEAEYCIVENELQLYAGSIAMLADLTRTVDKLEAGASVQYLEQQIDLSNFINYIIAQCWFANGDWPRNNFKMYQVACNSEGSATCGRWRFFFCDADYGMGYTGAQTVQLDMFNQLCENNSVAAKLFLACMKDVEFRSRFETRLLWAVSNPLRAEAVLSELAGIKSEIHPEMPNQLRRWRRPVSMDAWETEVLTLNRFAEQRAKYMLAHWQTLLKKYEGTN